MTQEKVRVTVYMYTREPLFSTVPQRYCQECDCTIRLVKKIASEVGEGRVEVVVKRWFNGLLEPLLKGAWPPPAIFVNGKRVSQGVVLQSETIRRKIVAAMRARGLINDTAKVA